MAQVVLIRPGTTEYDRQGRIQGTLDIPLCEEGHQDTCRLIDQLRGMSLEMVYTSPCQAATETASQIAGALSVKLKEIDKLRNLNHGLWQGMEIEEVRRRHPKVYRQWQESPESICPPQGEMLAEAECRVLAAVDKLCRKHRHARFAIVVPEPLLSIIRSHLMGVEPRDLWHGTAGCGTWELLDTDAKRLAGVS